MIVSHTTPRLGRLQEGYGQDTDEGTSARCLPNWGWGFFLCCCEMFRPQTLHMLGKAANAYLVINVCTHLSKAACNQRHPVHRLGEMLKILNAHKPTTTWNRLASRHGHSIKLSESIVGRINDRFSIKWLRGCVCVVVCQTWLCVRGCVSAMVVCAWLCVSIVAPFQRLEFRLHQRYRMTIDAHSLRYFIFRHNLSRESGNNVDQISRNQTLQTTQQNLHSFDRLQINVNSEIPNDQLIDRRLIIPIPIS